MTDVLLVSDQHLKDGFVARRSFQHDSVSVWLQTLAPGVLAQSNQGPFSSWNLIGAGQTFEGCDLIRQLEGGEIQIFESKSTCVKDHLSKGKEVLKRLAAMEERAKRDLQLESDMQWLAENRDKFVGQWIAIQGGKLLAAGSTAREVFSKVDPLTKAPPLVIRVDNEDLPFGGW